MFPLLLSFILLDICVTYNAEIDISVLKDRSVLSTTSKKKPTLRCMLTTIFPKLY